MVKIFHLTQVLVYLLTREIFLYVLIEAQTLDCPLTGQMALPHCQEVFHQFRVFSQHFGNMTHTHIGNFSNVLLKIGKKYTTVILQLIK